MKQLTEQTLKEVCKLGHGVKCCAFICCGPDGFECLKGTSLEAAIRQRLAAGTMNAQGDNCDGIQEDDIWDL